MTFLPAQMWRSLHMAYLSTNSVAEQVTAHLREGIQTGLWKALMPGRNRLAKDLGVSPTTITRALNSLEQEGLLVPQGAGQRRRIMLQEHQFKKRAQQIASLSLANAAPDQHGASTYLILMRPTNTTPEKGEAFGVFLERN